MSEEITVNVVDATGKMYHVKISKSDSVAKLKEEICKAGGWEMKDLLFGFKGKELGEAKNLETLEKMKIQQDSTLLVGSKLEILSLMLKKNQS
ncbi:unnamed protein product [Moneuplotes crassus]|uniref:Ubiquitin-like domain-containing protein n=1 Tax=Euplotes crassus TaxID=5936 RepID=A0AAD1Y2V7_EUPCR|nr:unnamed protein product [Moneuplotes crassus]